MEYLRTTVNSNELSTLFNLPQGLRNRDVEVIILPVENKTNEKLLAHSARGSLKKYANTALIPEEKGAWQNAVEKKYADS